MKCLVKKKGRRIATPLSISYLRFYAGFVTVNAAVPPSTLSNGHTAEAASALADIEGGYSDSPAVTVSVYPCMSALAAPVTNVPAVTVHPF